MNIMVQERIYGYFERNPQLHVLFVFDGTGFIRLELEEAQEWADDYIYRVFDGAWFNTKYAIENTWKDKRVVLLFPLTACPHTETEQLRFPLMDMLKANMMYQEEDYASFLQQHGLPQRFGSFVKRNMAEILSAKVSAILNGHIDSSTFSEDLVCRAFLSNYLGEKKLMEWERILVKMIIIDGADTEKKRTDFWYRVGKNKDVNKAVNAKLEKLFGRGLNENNPPKMRSVAESLKYNSITQLLDSLPDDPYKQCKITNPAVLDYINKIYELGTVDRQLGEKFSSAMKALAAGIREEEIIRVYGTDANYFCLTESLCWPILEEMAEKRLVAEPEEVSERMKALSLKLPPDSDVQAAIRFIERSASFYTQVRSLGTLKLNSTRAYVDKYVGEFYLVDMYYRHTLEAFHELLTKEIPIEQTLHAAKRQLDHEYAKMANVLNIEWLTCVKEKGMCFAGTGLNRQDDFYANESDPSVKQAIIVSDALRYEVAKELMQELAKERHMATISPYLAMLPTETKYCKPALLPHRSLELNGTDMAVDGNVLATTEQRTTHLGKYRGGSLCVRYEDVMNGDTTAMRELFKRPLVYIFHDTIDEASHSQSPFEVISACRKAIEQLAVLIRRLHATWNVTNVVLTADHGFLYNDIPFEEKDKHSITDDAVEKKTRYYLTDSRNAVEGVVKFPLNKVSSIKSTLQVAVPIGTNRLAAAGGYSFAHGGASLQEMIIPVIRSQRKREEKTAKVGVALMSHNLSMVSSRLKFHIIQSEAVSMTVMEREVTCRLYKGDEAVTQAKELTLNSPDATNLSNRVYEVTLTLNKPVSSSVLELRIYDKTDPLNPLVRETVKNNTIIEQDF